MSEVFTGASSVESTESASTNEGASGEQTQAADGQVVEGSAAPVDNGSTEQPAGQPSDIDQLEVVERDGKKYIPAEAIQKRIDQLVAQRNEARDFLEAVKTNPEVRQQFLDALKTDEKIASAAGTEAPAASPFYSWLDQATASSPEHKAFFGGFAKAFASELEAHVEQQIAKAVEEATAPLKRYVGQSEVERFSKNVKDFGKYQSKVAELMNKKGYDLEDAYKIASYEDKIKAGNSIGNAQSREKLNNTPIAGKQARQAGTSNAEPQSLSDAIKMSMRERGMKI